VNKAEIAELVGLANFGRKQKAAGRDGVIVSSHPLVSRVGADILRGGGNAMDAALAAAVAQTVVEPHMSTIFGVLSLMHYDAKSGKTSYLNGSMNAPLAGLPGFNAGDLATGRGVAVPGFWAAYEAGRGRFGSKSSSELIAPAVHLARDGFPVYAFLYGMMFEQALTIGLTQEGRDTYMPRGALLSPGEILKQPRFAQTLEALAAGGSDYFYRSAFTDKVVDAVKKAKGVLTREDFNRYEARWMEPAWSTYGSYKLAASPPPDTGGTHVAEILNLIERIPLKQWGRPTESADSLYWMTRFCAEVFTEGARMSDPQSWNLPLETILSKDYARIRLDLMKMKLPLDPPKANPYPGSNHLTVVDREGNITTVLHSVMSLPWSNGLIIDGVNIWAGGAHFMRQMPKPGDRGTCYVAPHIFFDAAGKPVLAAGSPSIGLIPNCVQNAVNILDFGMEIEASVHTPRFGGLSMASILGGPPAYMCEIDCGTPAMQAEVGKRGLNLAITSPWNFHYGSYEGIHIKPDGTAEACADPRRTGRAEAI
jgi:gamma-glutamyltranspeptidase/glutathione hydrolase